MQGDCGLWTVWSGVEQGELRIYISAVQCSLIKSTNDFEFTGSQEDFGNSNIIIDYVYNNDDNVEKDDEGVARRSRRTQRHRRNKEGKFVIIVILGINNLIASVYVECGGIFIYFDLL